MAKHRLASIVLVVGKRRYTPHDNTMTGWVTGRITHTRAF